MHSIDHLLHLINHLRNSINDLMHSIDHAINYFIYAFDKLHPVSCALLGKAFSQLFYSSSQGIHSAEIYIVPMYQNS